MTNRLSSLKEYLGYLKEEEKVMAAPLLPSDMPEEKAPDLLTATASSTADKITDMKICPSSNTSSLFRFFVDGVQRTVPVAEVTVNNMRVSLHLSHLIVGAMERVGTELKPFIFQEALVLIFPYQALKAADPTWSKRKPPGQELSSSGKIYEAVKNRGLLYSDTSITLRLGSDGQPSVLLQAGDLIRTGEVRQKALDRAKELLRIMEVGLLWELRQEHPDDWILLDGPIAPSLKYGRLVAPELEGLENIAKPDTAFRFLRCVIGAVKRVQIVPQGGLEVALNPGPPFVLPIYRFGEVIQQDDACVLLRII